MEKNPSEKVVGADNQQERIVEEMRQILSTVYADGIVVNEVLGPVCRLYPKDQEAALKAIPLSTDSVERMKYLSRWYKKWVDR